MRVCFKFVRATLLVCAIATSLGIPLEAATRYAVAVSSEGEYAFNVAGELLVDGTAWRLDLQPTEGLTRTHDAVIGYGDGSRIAVNHVTSTWFPLSADASPIYFASLADFYRAFASTAKVRSNGRSRRTGRADDGGHITTTIYTVKSDVHGEPVTSEVTVTVRGSVDPLVKNSPVLLPYVWQSSIRDADEKLREELEVRASSFSRLVYEVTRKISGGASSRQLITVALSAPTSVVTPPSAFRVPAAYKEQKPQIGFISSPDSEKEK